MAYIRINTVHSLNNSIVLNVTGLRNAGFHAQL